jgi:NADH-quinone oxidoreductase subunit L
MGWLAIIGFPLFSGFFSKDEILWSAYSSPRGHIGLWIAGVCGAMLTAFYMTRLMALTFWGGSRVDKSVHPHESSAIMTIPLIVLAILAAISGFVGVPHAISEYMGHIPNFWEHWLEPVIRKLPDAELASVTHTVSEEWALMGTSVFLALSSATAAYVMYTKKLGSADKFANSIKPIYNLVDNKYYVDEIYFGAIINPLISQSKKLWYYVDVNFIDKMTYAVTDFTQNAGKLVKTLQNGNMQQYAMYISLGLVAVLSFVLMR